MGRANARVAAFAKPLEELGKAMLAQIREPQSAVSLASGSTLERKHADGVYGFTVADVLVPEGATPAEVERGNVMRKKALRHLAKSISFRTEFSSAFAPPKALPKDTPHFFLNERQRKEIVDKLMEHYPAAQAMHTARRTLEQKLDRALPAPAVHTEPLSYELPTRRTNENIMRLQYEYGSLAYTGNGREIMLSARERTELITQLEIAKGAELDEIGEQFEVCRQNRRMRSDTDRLYRIRLRRRITCVDHVPAFFAIRSSQRFVERGLPWPAVGRCIVCDEQRAIDSTKHSRESCKRCNTAFFDCSPEGLDHELRRPDVEVLPVECEVGTMIVHKAGVPRFAVPLMLIASWKNYVRARPVDVEPQCKDFRF